MTLPGEVSIALARQRTITFRVFIAVFVVSLLLPLITRDTIAGASMLYSGRGAEIACFRCAHIDRSTAIALRYEFLRQKCIAVDTSITV